MSFERNVQNQTGSLPQELKMGSVDDLQEACESDPSISTVQNYKYFYCFCYILRQQRKAIDARMTSEQLGLKTDERKETRILMVLPAWAK